MPVSEVWDAITNPARLAEWWLPFDADITVDLRVGGEMVMVATGDEPMTITSTFLRVEPPRAARAHPRRPGLRHAVGARGGRCRMRAAAEPLRDRHVRRHRQQLRRRAARLARPAGAMPCRVIPSPGTGMASPKPKPTTPPSDSPEPSHEAARSRPELRGVQRRLRRRRGTEPRASLRPRQPGELLSWAFATAHFANRTEPGGTYGLDDYCTRDFANNIGAEIMGRNKFSPHRGPWEN